jgi:hypothetical protein
MGWLCSVLDKICTEREGWREVPGEIDVRKYRIQKVMTEASEGPSILIYSLVLVSCAQRRSNPILGSPRKVN